MFNKRITLVLITLVFMLSLSVVSAVDTNTTDDVATGDVEEEPPSGSVKCVPQNKNLNSENSVNETFLNDQSSDESVSVENNSDEGVLSEYSQNDTALSDTHSDVYQSYELNGQDVETYYDADSNYVLTLSKGDKPISHASITVSINKIDYNVKTDGLGKAVLPLNLAAGNYTVSASYGNLTIKNFINVLPVVVSKNLVTTYNSVNHFTAIFLTSEGAPLKNTNVKFIVNGKKVAAKTDSKGVATLDLVLKVGKYTVYAVHPNGYKISKTVVVKHSLTASSIKKYYGSSKKFTATFIGRNSKVLKNTPIKFKYRGKYYTRTTDSKGKASILINSQPGTYGIVSINTKTGEKITNTIKILPTLKADKMTVFTGTTSKFKVTVYKTNGKVAKNTKVRVYIDGKKNTVKTDSKGIAKVNFKLSKGTYYFKSVDLDTGYKLKTKVVVKLASIKASNVVVLEKNKYVYKVKLLNQNGKVAKDTKMKIILNGVTHTVKTNSKGVASITFKLNKGTYNVVCKDSRVDYTVTKKITVISKSDIKYYSKYGVSPDGKKLLAIGRPSAVGEESKYGYTYYMVQFERVCPYCGSHELYWSIFWAGSEYANYGVFPATGNKEGSSAEGGIFCANCDCDFSIFGHNRGSSGGDLKVISKPVKSSKAAAYLLKSGKYYKLN